MTGNLISPGVQVSIINDAFYGSASPGTVPLIVFATQANKTATSGTGIAPYTVPSMANTLFLATSQLDVLSNFGNPLFESYQGTPVNGSELNEYGLHAAYSFMGIKNQAYLLRADIDLAQLAPSVSPPVGPPVAGTYWFDLSATSFGVFISNGNSSPGAAWVSQTVLIPTTSQVNSAFTPLSSFGNNGNIAVVPWTQNNYFYQKISNVWYQIGSGSWMQQFPTTVTGISNPANANVGDVFSINGTNITITGSGSVSSIVSTINASGIPNITAASVNTALSITNTSGGSITISNISGTSLSILGISPITTNGLSVYYTNNASWPANSTAGSIWFKESPSNNGANYSVQYYNGTSNSFVTLSAPFYPFNSQLSDGNTSKDTAVLSALGNQVIGNVYVGYDSVANITQLRRWNGTNWATLTYEAGLSAPTTAPVAGTYYYNTNLQADIMVSTGTNWVGYRTKFPLTDVNGPQISGSAPTTQSTGTALQNNDIWINSSDTENYPQIYLYNSSISNWQLVNNTDHTSPFGIIFADARTNSGTAYAGLTNNGAYNFNSVSQSDMALSSYLEPDAPDPENYPAGMMLFNTRYSTGNVKVWNPTYFSAGGYDPNTNFTVSSYKIGTTVFSALSSPAIWVTASGNQENGAPYMLRKAQRIMVVNALAATINNNQDIRSELVNFNLIATPGYIELLSEMTTLNTDQNNTAFIVGDTPIRLDSSSQSIQNFATNTANVSIDNESGWVTHNDYLALYYPWGLGQDAFGNSVMVPPSTLALRTIAYSDEISYPWYAPAGFQRGLITNATSVGYLTGNGTYQSVILNQGQRDTLYSNSINPIAYIPNRGLVVYGQKTGSNDGSLLGRINVSRLACYLAYNLDNIVKPFLFEQNNQTTWKAATNTVEQFLNTLVGQNAISDYAVICDATNNTAATIDANQLWIDVLVLPITAIEFIYLPVRIESNTTASAASSSASASTISSTSLSNNINISN